MEGPTRDLARWAAGLVWEDVPGEVRGRLLLALYDTLGVTAAGARLPENAALVRAWEPPPGPAPVVGTRLRTTVDAAGWLNGVAACSLELDEGNKYARGHPAAHGFPAVLAVTSARRPDGPTLGAALLVAYEVASRFGRATTLRRGMHPHGNWGVTGAAAGVSRLLGLGPEVTAAAIDTACGLPVAGHFEAALSGNPVRNAWIGASNVSGIAAARMAVAGVARTTGMAAYTLGDLLGRIRPDALTEDLGSRYDVTLNYYKRHASCSYTHPPTDAILELRRTHPELSPERVTAVDVETYSLAAGLARTDPRSRLAAMFSIPYVVAAALVHGSFGPEATSTAARADPLVTRVMELVRVRPAGDLDARLPEERPARVTVTLDDGRTFTAEMPNPIGDAAHRPLGWSGVEAKLTDLLGPLEPTPARLRGIVDGLPGADDAGRVLDALVCP